MNRTRVVTLSLLAICLIIVVASLLLRLVSERATLQFYVAATIFSVGVVALDFLGVLGGHGHDGGDFTGVDHGADFGGGHDAGGDMGGVDAAGGHVADATDFGGDSAGEIGHGDGHEVSQPLTHGTVPILSALGYLRLFVYFCLGFGPAGWAGMAAGWGALGSLLIALPAGVLAALAARAFFRFQGRDTGLWPESAALLQEEATVLVPLDDRTMGKVRVQAGMSVSEVYALAMDEGARYQKGDVVRIVQVSDDCVRVR